MIILKIVQSQTESQIQIGALTKKKHRTQANPGNISNKAGECYYKVQFQTQKLTNVVLKIIPIVRVIIVKNILVDYKNIKTGLLH